MFKIERILPYHNFVIKTYLKKHEMIRKLNEVVEQNEVVFEKNKHLSNSKNYVGKINNNGFDIKRKKDPYNSFSLNITGIIISENPEFIEVQVKVKLDTLLVLLTIIWSFLACIACAFTTYLWVTDKFSPVLIMPHIMLIVISIISVKAYQRESTIVKSDLNLILEV